VIKIEKGRKRAREKRNFLVLYRKGFSRRETSCDKSIKKYYDVKNGAILRAIRAIRAII